ncbi:MAG: hypothetical protein IME99_08680 [Proteobacteria bacterium]|nr:hypothetical protein [Pseudomonadota bacterium]
MLLTLLLVGCVPKAHTLAPYSEKTEEAAALEAEAAKACSAERKGAVSGMSSFTTDGCTLYPDGEWVECCIEHDKEYWCGGSRVKRKESDLKMKSCIAKKGFGYRANLMYLGVRLGAHPLMPVPWRWGYGWSWPRGYEEAEKRSPSGSSFKAGPKVK